MSAWACRAAVMTVPCSLELCVMTEFSAQYPPTHHLLCAYHSGGFVFLTLANLQVLRLSSRPAKKLPATLVLAPPQPAAEVAGWTMAPKLHCKRFLC
jgi:hypothetical protein